MRVQSQLQLQQKPVRLGWCGCCCCCCCCCCCVWARPTSQPASQPSKQARQAGAEGEGARGRGQCCCWCAAHAMWPAHRLEGCAQAAVKWGRARGRGGCQSVRSGRGPGAGAGAAAAAAAAASFVLRRQRKASQAGKQRGAPALTRTDSCPPQPLKIQMNPTCDLPYSTVRSKMTSQRSLFRNRAAKRRVSRFGF